MAHAALAAPYMPLVAAPADGDTQSGARSLGTGHFYGQSHLQNDSTGDAIVLPDHSRVEIDELPPPRSSAGSLVAWVMPLWAGADDHSHTFLSWRWQGPEQSYLALSLGWWEPEGSRKLYFVLSNQDFAFCEMPGRFDYAIFAPNEWTMLAATWTAGKPGYVRLFVDGQRICDRQIEFGGGRHSTGHVYLGSDQGASDQRNRRSDFIVNRLEFLQQPLSETQVRDRYRRGGGASSRKWMSALIGNSTAVSPLRETRAMFDEDDHWVRSRLETDTTLARVKRAGFNVYVPCVWNGAEAEFDTDAAPVSKAFRSRRAAQDDPLQYLIDAAHRQGIALHLWFDVARRATAALPAEYGEGAPAGAFNVQNPAFRTFVAGLIRDAAVRYDADGINLDYVRSMGACSSRSCEAQYRESTGRSLDQDWRAAEGGSSVPSLIEWNGSAVSKILYELAGQLRSKKPRLFISVDTIPFDHSRLDQGVNVSEWIAKGAIDSVVYMAYDTPLDVAAVADARRRLPRDKLLLLVRNFENVDDGYADISGEEMRQFVSLIRSRWPGTGLGFYHYPHLTAEQVRALGTAAFAVPAASGWTRPGF